MTTSDQRVPFGENNIRQLRRVIIAKSMEATWQRLHQLIADLCSSNHLHRSTYQRARCSRPFVSGIQSVDESLRSATGGKQFRDRTFGRSEASLTPCDGTAHHGVDPCRACHDPSCFSRFCLLPATWFWDFVDRDRHRRRSTRVDDCDLHWCRQTWIFGILSNGTHRIDSRVRSLADTLRLARHPIRHLGIETSPRS